MIYHVCLDDLDLVLNFEILFVIRLVLLVYVTLLRGHLNSDTRMFFIELFFLPSSFSRIRLFGPDFYGTLLFIYYIHVLISTSRINFDLLVCFRCSQDVAAETH